MNTYKEVAIGRLAGTSIHCFCAVEGDDVVRVRGGYRWESLKMKRSAGEIKGGSGPGS
jgi:hypothetical protein